MDPVRIDKFQAMKRYRKRRTQHLRLLLLSLVRCLAIVLFLGLFLSCPLWLPHVSSCLKLFFFFFGRLSEVIRVISRPESLFILCNIIVIFLVGESKLSKTSPAVDIQEEYERRRSHNDWQESKRQSAADEALVEEEEEENGSSDEIDKKAEDFIARINWQRRLEGRRLLNRDQRQ